MSKGKTKFQIEKAKERPRFDFDTDMAKFTDRQMEAVRHIDSGKIKFLLYGGALGGGKDLALDTPLATTDGWTTMGEIKVGDRVFDEQGLPCSVVGVSEIMNNKDYRVTFSDGSEIIAGEGHEWVTETNKDRRANLRRSDEFRKHRRETRAKRGTGKRPDLAERNSIMGYSVLSKPELTAKTTKEIADTVKDGVQTNHAVLVPQALQLPVIDLPIEPYVLGAWLGDGTSVNGNITGNDEEIFEWIRYYGFDVTNHANILSHCILGLKEKLRDLGVLGDKHIPQTYLRSDEGQRLGLLQGLMDTDGYCDSRGQCEIQLVNKKLSDGVYELLCSLGIKVQMRLGRARLYGKDCGEKYRLKFLTDKPVFRIKRKLDRQKRRFFRGTHNRRYIISVEPIETVPTRCIEVDSPSHLYLAGKSMIPTHNSYYLRWMGIRLLMYWFMYKGLKNVQLMLACEDYPSLKDRQLSKIGREFPAWLGKMYSDHAEYGRCYMLNPEYGSGVLCFRNLDDPSKYQSSEWAAILVDELTKNDVEVFTHLRMRLRWPGLSDIECLFIGATNPGGIGHNYVKALWMDKNFPIEFIKPVDYRDNFAYVPSKAEDNPYLDAAYWQMLGTLPPHLRSAFKDGSWDVFVGQAFQEWSRNFHVMKATSPLYPAGRPLYMTFDWGFGKPFSIGWWWIDDDGRKYRFNEWYGWNGTPDSGLRLTDSEIAEGIIKREMSMGLNEKRGGVINANVLRLCDPTCFNKKPDYKGGGQGPSTAEVFMNMGLMMRPGDPNRALKYRQMHEHLRVPRDDNEKVVGTPMMQVYETCHHFIRTVPSLTVDPNNIEDVDTSLEDHCYDEGCLLVMARPITKMEVKEVRKPPQDITEVARMEREAIWEEVRVEEEQYASLFE